MRKTGPECRTLRNTSAYSALCQCDSALHRDAIRGLDLPVSDAYAKAQGAWADRELADRDLKDAQLGERSRLLEQLSPDRGDTIPLVRQNLSEHEGRVSICNDRVNGRVLLASPRGRCSSGRNRGRCVRQFARNNISAPCDSRKEIGRGTALDGHEDC